MSQFRDAYDEFRRAGFEVAAISVDSPYAHRVWAGQLNIQYPLISDFGREFAGAYHVPLRTGGPLPGTTTRSAFVVDAKKVVRYAWYAPEGRGLPPVDEILTAVREMSDSPD